MEGRIGAEHQLGGTALTAAGNVMLREVNVAGEPRSDAQEVVERTVRANYPLAPGVPFLRRLTVRAP
jgi:hypothetical protein